MGQISDAFRSTWRQFVTDNVPASGANKPSKAEIQAVGKLIETALASVGQGINRYATTADRDAATGVTSGQLGIIFKNNGSTTDPENGFYQYTGSAWERADWFEKNLSPALLDIVGVSASANQFDVTAITTGKEVYSDGTLSSEPNSAVSAAMYVRGWDYLTVSGLFDNGAGGPRYWVFYGPDGSTVVGTGYAAASATTLSLAVPDDAWFFRFSVWQRNASPGSAASVQVERGTSASSFVAFSPTAIAGFDGKVIARPQTETGGDKNLFDAARITDYGYEVYGDGSLQPESNSIASAPIYIGHLAGKRLTISGLQAATFSRFYAFYTTKPLGTAATGFLSGGSIDPSLAGATVAVPDNAKWFRFSPKQRTAGAADLSAVQVEAGSVATSYQTFTPRLVAIDGMRLGDVPASDTPSGGIGIAFGDSITETTNTDAGVHLYPDGYRANWPDFAVPILQPDAYYSYARSGAHFASLTAGLVDNQKFAKQIDAAITDNHAARWIVVAMGTNDFGSSPAMGGTAALGDYATAMGKTLTVDETGAIVTTLDLTVALEAARLGFFRIQRQWPTALKFCSLPLQRGDADPDAMASFLADIVKIAGRYGFEVIDAHHDSGIVHDFEGGTVTGSISGTTLTVTACSLSTPLAVGRWLSGPSFTQSVQITALGTGTGETGTYTVSAAQTIGSSTITVLGGRDTIDGLHPVTVGQKKQGDLIAARIMARLVA